MKSALVFLALVAIIQARVPLSIDHRERIVNGDAVKPGEIPYQVSLQLRSYDHICGGSVLNKYYVITAAHCVYRKPAFMMQVVADIVDLVVGSPIHRVTNTIVHAQYDPGNSWQNDIALVKVETPFVESTTLSFVPLPEPGQEIPADAVAVISGWGHLWQEGPTPTTLQHAEILIASQDYCTNAYSDTPLTIHNTHVCAHDPVNQVGPCQGDSGGPLTVDGKLVGLVSWAIGCANAKYPTIFTRVPEYIDWINANAV